MSSTLRKVGLVVFACFILFATGCGGNAKKIVGKWKVTAIGDQSKDKDKGGMGDGIDLFLEFKSDGSGSASIEATDPKAKEFAKAMNDALPTFKWSVNGDKIELTSASKDGKGEGLFGKKKEKGTGKIKFEGDTLTITPDEAGEKTVKLVRAK